MVLFLKRLTTGFNTMNNRIKELADQAKKYSLDAMRKISDKEQALKVYSESYDTKFAELIVRECISSVGSQADKAYLKKHFGLHVESDIIYPAVEESWSVESQYKRNVLP